jgi:integrase
MALRMDSLWVLVAIAVTLAIMAALAIVWGIYVLQRKHRGMARADKATLRNKTTRVTAIQRSRAGATDYVAHLSVGQVKLLADVAGRNRRHGERNSLLIKTIFDGALRVSEALGIKPCDLVHTPDGWLVLIMGKGLKPGTAAITAVTASELQAYCYRHRLGDHERIFPFTRSQAFRIVTSAFDMAGMRRPGRDSDHVGAVHVLRHSGAIARLRASGNPKALQEQLRHKSALMTLRYLKTIGHDEAMQTQQQIDVWQE